MEIEGYLRLVADKIAEARGRVDSAEVKRLLILCAETCQEKAEEIEP